ncbi:uncharacterized protein KY384_002731 [Bacidia gigantensis]|uniref:uncharacterized protein n=1 Tax=Bacidia gigantensis TaxID=2732470 RepID=UPI001D037913|nr:uncharacterized protein KY384_002731 [Bacidia gigantensis]KAG8532853.1 hypothetical protein KY384_002731 [Bacidia gigantensis]
MSIDQPHVEDPKGKKRKRQPASSRDNASVTKSFESLKWREVPFPETFEDAEGFFGLEEVSDVDITKDEQLGQIKYQLVSKATKQPNIKAISDSIESRARRRSPSVKTKDDEEEWSGFADSKSTESEPSKVIRKRKGDLSLQSLKESKQSRFELLSELTENDTDVADWEPLGLSEYTKSSVARMRFSKPTPIQKAVIPEIIKGFDVIGKAPTGSGKTLAFGIPMFEHLMRHKIFQNDRLQKDDAHEYYSTSLIVSPTRELAHQLSDHLNDLCSDKDVSIVTITGGLSAHKQKRLLRRSDIIIGTPGRLWELMSEGNELRQKLSKIKFLVLDEADRLLSEGNFKELEEIIHALDVKISSNESLEIKKSRQTLVFSATLQKDLQRKLTSKSKNTGSELMGKQDSMEYLLKKLNFKDAKPKFIDVSPKSAMAENLTESILECAALEKDLYLYSLLLHHPKTRTLVFVNSISAVRRLVPLLQNLNVQAQALHSQMPQKARLRSIERFSSPSSPSSILIATDVAARGLDIPSVQLIVHYHVPRAADAYVHRSGRTARAEKSGSSILLCAPEEVQGVRRLIAKIHVQSHQKKHSINTQELDGRILDRLKHRVSLSKKVTDASLAKEKHGQEDNWLKNAAEELGVEYDSEEFGDMKGTRKGRGQGRRQKEKQARELSKDELASLKAQLREELKHRVNVGVSERYLTAGGGAIDVDSLLKGEVSSPFLGKTVDS